VRVTRGVIDSETQLAAISRFCRGRGMTIPEGKGSMDAEAVEGYIDDPETPEDCRTVLSIRRDLGKSALAKLDRLVDATCEDGRVRGLLQYYGAHQTGRWAP
jgi:DNA polymerase